MLEQQSPSILGLLEHLESPYLHIDQNRCVVVRNRNVTCRHCAEACTSGCIEVADGRLHLEPERCIGCGTCATVCPTAAITSIDPDDEELYERASAKLKSNGGEVTFTCELLAEADAVEDPVVLKCLGRVEESLFMRLAQDGAKHIVLFHGNCSACPHATGLDTARITAGTANTLLDVWGKDLRVDLDFDPSLPVFEDDAETAPADADARQEDGSAVPDEQEVAADEDAPADADEEESLVAKVEEDGTLPHFVPQRRLDLLESLRDLAPADLSKEAPVSTRLWGHVLINPDYCASCRVCSIFCPTGALHRFEDEDGTFGLLHNPSLCVKCHACQDSCINHALLVNDSVSVGDLLDGTVYRHAMKEPAVVKTGAHSAVNSMRYLLHTDNLYE